jgi:Fe-S-cluster containining protein
VTACASLLCDNCKRPGACCKGFALGRGSFGKGLTALEVLAKLASTTTGLTAGGVAYDAGNGDYSGRTDLTQVGLPFLPDKQAATGEWSFRCPLLGSDGRCTEYDHRPPLCRDYQAGEDALCAMHVSDPGDFCKETRA